MTMSRQNAFLSELAAGHSGPPIPLEKRAYFQTRLRNRLFNFILEKFLEQQKNGLTKAALGRRIGKTPDVVSRLLGAPGNWTLDTVSDLLIGINAEELEPASSSLLDRQPRNYRHADYLGGAELSWIAELHKKPAQSPARGSILPTQKAHSGLTPTLGEVV